MRLHLLAAGLVAAAPALAQSNCRLYVAGQYDWGGKAGFYLDFEGSRLAELPVILGIADGNGWRFISHTPGFVPEREYRIRAVVAPDRAELYLDGIRVAESGGTWAPAPAQPLEVNNRPAWANEPGDWLAVVREVRIELTRDGQTVERQVFDLSAAASRPLGLQLLSPAISETSALAAEPGDTLTAEATLHFLPSDPRPASPLVDRYGQCAHGDWPRKVRSDADLVADIATEDEQLARMPPSPDYDEFGGWLQSRWTEAATGFFRVVRRNGFWWLVSPRGNPCFYIGVSSVPAQTWETTPVSGREFLYEWLPPRDGPFAAAWSANHWGVHDGTEYVCFYTCNLVRKYGPDWIAQAHGRALRRLRAWGFSGAGKWGGPETEVEVPVLNWWGVPAVSHHPDVFDPAVVDALHRRLEAQIAPRRNDPRVLGWSIGNEYDEIIKPEEVRDILSKPAGVWAKRALVDHALATIYGGDIRRLAEAWGIEAETAEQAYSATPGPPPEDVEQLRLYYQDRYYATLYETVKTIDPNHLYMGNWIVPGWWVSEDDWRTLARHCDVIGYDRYAREFHSDLLARLAAESDKPILCGEYSFPAWYDGARGLGRYPCWAKDDEEAGELYARWIRDAAHDPYCVGTIWFIYRDQPLTGRGPGSGEQIVYGENFAFGLVTETDRPKMPLVLRVRDANLAAAAWRAEATELAEREGIR